MRPLTAVIAAMLALPAPMPSQTGGTKAPSPQPTSIVPIDRKWEVSAGYGKICGAACVVAPKQFTGKLLGYFVRPGLFDISQADWLDVEIEIVGDGIFGYPPNGCEPWGPPATVRIYIQRTNAIGNLPDMEFRRWWPNDISYSYPLQSATGITLTIPLKVPHTWTSVYGKFDDDPAAGTAFADAKADLEAVGVTFGGGCFFGHGVYQTSGSSNVYIKRWAVR